MPLLAISFPPFDPLAVAIGPFVVRWYALAYIVGLLIGWRYCLALADRPPGRIARREIDDFLAWATLGVVLGGRVGFVLFYNLPYYLANPLQVFAIWHGGMSFHGGALGVATAILLFGRQRKLPLFALADIVVEAVPIGLFFGRIANFINDELWGRVTDVPWAVIFPNGGMVPRHPSQLYEAACEGIVLFLLLLWAERRRWRERPGMVSGLFLIGYAVARMSGELFRQPDVQLGFLFFIGQFGVTMGQLLSIPVLLAGIAIILWARREPAVVAAPRRPQRRERA